MFNIQQLGYLSFWRYYSHYPTDEYLISTIWLLLFSDSEEIYNYIQPVGNIYRRQENFLHLLKSIVQKIIRQQRLRIHLSFLLSFPYKVNKNISYIYHKAKYGRLQGKRHRSSQKAYKSAPFASLAIIRLAFRNQRRKNERSGVEHHSFASAGEQISLQSKWLQPGPTLRQIS